MVILNFNEKYYSNSGKRLSSSPDSAVVIFLDNRSVADAKGLYSLRDLLQFLPRDNAKTFFTVELEDSVVLVHFDGASYISSHLAKGADSEREVDRIRAIFGPPVPLSPGQIESLSKNISTKAGSVYKHSSTNSGKGGKSVKLEKYAFALFMVGVIAYGASLAAGMYVENSAKNSKMAATAFTKGLEQQYRLKAGGIINQLSPKLSLQLREIIEGVSFYDVSSYEYSGGKTKLVFDTKGVSIGKDRIEKFGQVDREGDSFILTVGKSGI